MAEHDRVISCLVHLIRPHLGGRSLRTRRMTAAKVGKHTAENVSNGAPLRRFALPRPQRDYCTDQQKKTNLGTNYTVRSEINKADALLKHKPLQMLLLYDVPTARRRRRCGALASSGGRYLRMKMLQFQRKAFTLGGYRRGH